MDKRFWLGLKLIPVLDKKIKTITDSFESAERIWLADRNGLSKIDGIAINEVDEIITRRNNIDLERWWQRYKNIGINILTIFDDDYPPLLREITNPPTVLFFKGDLILNYSNAVAIVGSRLASIHGSIIAEELASELSKEGVTVVSGVARGIDGSAHKGAMRGQGGTIGVLGCSLDVIYPPENKKLYGEICKHGSLVSEYPITTKPLKWNFPARNRIISGLTKGVVIVEASEKSGALITADFALEQGREVCAVPGNPKNKLSKGPHKLLKSGAYLVEDAGDILDVLGLIGHSEKKKESSVEISLDEQRVLNFIDWELKHVDEITRELNVSSSDAAILLTILEIKGLIKQDIGKRYLRIH
ncbi:MAG TPA: DNA-protecting protein DprA [Actinobacteria bacterium]|nr:DNA-protecting protein DprA [Actinomycetota bacterium]